MHSHSSALAEGTSYGAELSCQTKETAGQGNLLPERLICASWCLSTHTQMALMVQGMETALQRTGQEVAGSGGVDKNHPDLVAYWTFDEGRGYVVHDASGHGHDLFLTNEPQWQVGHSTLAGHLTDPGCRSANGRITLASSV